MALEIIVPDSAFKYILYQRTAHIASSKNIFYMIFYKIFKKLSPSFHKDIIPSFHKTTLKMEAALRQDAISQGFNEDILSDYHNIKSSLPERCSSILDIGCGVAGIDVLLFKHYGESKELHFNLLDKTSVTKQLFYGFKETAAFYNSLPVAKQLLSENGIPNDNIHTLEVKPDYRIDVDGEVDLIISLYSWGFHYPVSTYIDRAHDLLKVGGRLIMDIRRNKGGEEEFGKRFSDYNVIYEEKKSIRVVAIK